MKRMLPLLLVFCLSCCAHAQGYYLIDITWDRSDLPPDLQFAKVTFNTQAHEQDDYANRERDTPTASVIAEKATGWHWLEDFPNNPGDMWVAGLSSGSVRVQDYNGAWKTIWWQRKHVSGISWTDWEHEFHVRLFSY